MPPDEQFYVVSLKHTQRKQSCVTFWGPDDAGYRWVVSDDCLYDAARISADAMYYCDFLDDVAVPASAVRALLVPPPPGEVAGDRGLVILNTKQNLEALFAAAVTAVAAREVVSPPKPENPYEGHERAFRELAESIGRAEGKDLKCLLDIRRSLLWIGHNREHRPGEANRLLRNAHRALEAMEVPETSGPVPR